MVSSHTSISNKGLPFSLCLNEQEHLYPVRKWQLSRVSKSSSKAEFCVSGNPFQRNQVKL